jgi:hypothetical protein
MTTRRCAQSSANTAEGDGRRRQSLALPGDTFHCGGSFGSACGAFVETLRPRSRVPLWLRGKCSAATQANRSLFADRGEFRLWERCRDQRRAPQFGLILVRENIRCNSPVMIFFVIGLRAVFKFCSLLLTHLAASCLLSASDNPERDTGRLTPVLISALAGWGSVKIQLRQLRERLGPICR